MTRGLASQPRAARLCLPPKTISPSCSSFVLTAFGNMKTGGNTPKRSSTVIQRVVVFNCLLVFLKGLAMLFKKLWYSYIQMSECIKYIPFLWQRIQKLFEESLLDIYW